MVLYKRDIFKKLLCLRLSFLVLLIGCLFAFTHDASGFGYMSAFVAILMSVIVVDDLRVLSDSFEVIKYYFFGLIKTTKRFEKNRIITNKPIGPDFGEYKEILVDDASDSGLGCLLSLFFFGLSPQIIKKEFYIEMLDARNSVVKSAYVLLDIQEFGLLKAFFSEQQ